MAIARKVADRIAAGLRRFQPVLASAKTRDVNESDTVLIVTDLLQEVFGYDKYSEITSEHMIRSTYCDLAVRLDNIVTMLIEVKAIGLELRDLHVKQAVDYAANQGVEWCALTNGFIWRVYRVQFTKPINAELVVDLDLLAAASRNVADIERIALLAKEGWQKARLGEYHSRRQVLSRFSLAALLLSDPVIEVLRRELRRLSDGVRVEPDELRAVLEGEVLKREVLEGEKADAARRCVSRSGAKSLRATRPGAADADAGEPLVESSDLEAASEPPPAASMGASAD